MKNSKGTMVRLNLNIINNKTLTNIILSDVFVTPIKLKVKSNYIYSTAEHTPQNIAIDAKNNELFMSDDYVQKYLNLWHIR